MAKNANFVSHKKSKQIIDGKPKLPLATDLVEGEIAINFAENVETLSIKNESGDVVTFSSDNYYTEQKLGSGFTGENSGKTVTEALENIEITVDQVIDSGTSASTNAVSTKAVVDKLIEDEQVWAISLNELNNNKFGYAEFDNNSKSIEFYKDSDEASSGDPISTVDLSSFSIDIDQVIDSGTSASTDAVSTSAVYDFVTSYTPSITVDQDFSNTASTNPISTKAVYSAVTDNELVWTNAFVALSGTVSAHTENTNIHLTAADKEKINSIDTLSGTVTAHTANTEIHVTAADKTTWNAKVDASAIADFFNDAKYEDSGNTKVINFYHGNTIKATIDASDFIVDGMVDDVKIENGYLVIDFNTASGKQDISIPLTDIFDPSNYYDKDDIDDLVGSGFTSSSITDVIIENEEIVSAALTDLDERKLDASAYTPTDLSNYYTKSETSGATELATAFSGKLDATAYTPTDLSNYYTKSETSGATELSTAFSTKADTATTLAGYGITDAYTKSETSGATEISAALEGKVNASDIISAITPSNSGSTNPIATKVVAENERVTANALIDLDERKLDASAYTPTDLSNYYTKSETSGATEISNALGGKSSTGHTHEASGVTAMTGYQIASSSASVLTTDSLLQTIGKLEKRISLLETALGGMTLVKLTSQQYADLTVKDPNTIYIIND